MQSGGARHEQVGLCPHCHSPDIRTRRQRHRQMLWRCRNCNRVFATPTIGAVSPAEWPNVDLVRPHWIRAMDRGARRQGQGRGSQGQAQRGNFGCGCLFIIVIIVGVAGFFAIAMNANFPGADALRTAGQEVSQRIGGNGEEEGQSPPGPTLPPTPRPTNTPAPTPTPIPLPPPNLRHHDLKAYMLELINNERVRAGIPPVTLGDNIAAQLHAEASLENCISSHWGVDGLKPYMRYSLAGGYQTNGENGSGSDYCIKASDRYLALRSIKSEIREMVEGWMSSPGHRRNILDKWHEKVNIGLAWDKYNIVGYQHFEGGVVQYSQLPEITNGTLSFSGRTMSGMRFSSREELGLQIYYDPPPHSLTRGQVSRTYCYDLGRQIAAFRYPLTGNSFWRNDEFKTTYSPCPNPYDVASDAPAPKSHDEAHEFWERAYVASQDQKEETITVPWITASEWTARGTDFSITADIRDLLDEHGPGVYTILLWGEMDGEDVPISEYSIFYEVEPPDTYNPDFWK